MKKATNIPVAAKEEHYSHKLTHPIARRWFEDLDRLVIHEKELALLPVGWGSDGKAPMIKGWPSHPGFTTKELEAVRGIRAVGARTGIRSGPLLCFDIDGESPLELACSLGMEPWATTTWQVHRDNDPFRLKVLFKPTAEQIEQLPARQEFQGKTITKYGDETRKGEALEVFFHTGRQVIILGEHPSSGGKYIWPTGLGPEELSPPPDAWWKHALHIAAKSKQRTTTSTRRSSSFGNAKKRLNPCPICGRHSAEGNGLWCEQTEDELILCMPGSTFNADPNGVMKIGTVVKGYALVKRSPIAEGDCLTFAPHRPQSPRYRIGRPQRIIRRRADVQA